MKATDEAKQPDHAGVAFHPPLLLVASLGAGFLLGWLVPLPVFTSPVDQGKSCMANDCGLCQLNGDPDQRIILRNHTVLFLQNEKEQGALLGSGVIIPVRHAETVFDLTPRSSPRPSHYSNASRPSKQGRARWRLTSRST